MLSPDGAPSGSIGKLDRHALVMAIWLPFGLVAASLMHFGFGTGGPVWVLMGFGAVLLAFAGHVIVNVVLESEFQPREVALGLVLYAMAILALVLAVLTVDGFAAVYFLPLASGLAMLALAVVFYMVTRFGVRPAFEKFDVIRDFKAKGSARGVRR